MSQSRGGGCKDDLSHKQCHPTTTLCNVCWWRSNWFTPTCPCLACCSFGFVSPDIALGKMENTFIGCSIMMHINNYVSCRKFSIILWPKCEDCPLWLVACAELYFCLSSWLFWGKREGYKRSFSFKESLRESFRLWSGVKCIFDRFQQHYHHRHHRH